MKTILTILISVLAMSFHVFGETLSLNIPTSIEDEGKKHLSATLVYSDTNTARPVIFIQTPYDKDRMVNTIQYVIENPHLWTGVQLPVDTNNYNYVVMDWRGFYANKDAAITNHDRGLDGYDAVEWIAGQKWCNGKVGTWGPSALGVIQFQTARHQPPHLVCSVPIVKGYNLTYHQYYYGGVLRKEHLDHLRLLGFPVGSITEIPTYNAVWKIAEANNNYPDEINTPMLMISGWYDNFPRDVVHDFGELREESGVDVRDKHKLIMGPWLHSNFGLLEQGILEYPGGVDIPLDATEQFFDYHLLGAKNGWPMEPETKYFRMGDDKWFDSDANFFDTKVADTLWLHTDGLLDFVEMGPTFVEVPPDTIIYDPRDPSPTTGGCRLAGTGPDDRIGPQDIRERVESRNDLLVYSTPVLEKDIVLHGKLIVRLYVASDRTDTDFAIRLCDVYPDGKSVLVRQGIRRMRYRYSYEEEELMTPGEVYEVDIEIDPLELTFKAGHKLRIDITSSNYPIFGLNLNNGGEQYTEGDTLIAQNLVYHSFERPSKVIIPTIRPTSVEETTEELPQDLRIWPNPVSDIAIVRYYSNSDTQVAIKIVNLFGQTVKTFEKTNGSTGLTKQEIYCGDIVPGTYFMVIYTGMESYSKLFYILR